MGTNEILIALGGMILLAFVLEQVARALRLPSVILLLAGGIGIRLLLNPSTDLIEVAQQSFLPAIGTIGLILIVLEGALELEVRKENMKVLKQGLLSSLVGIVLNTVALSLVFRFGFHVTWAESMANAIPISVISSAVAIPSAKRLPGPQRDFVTYESSFSDILGVLLFSLFTAPGELGLTTIAAFSLNFLFTIIAAILISLFIVWYLDKVEHHVRFLPVFAFLLLTYGLAKMIHLSPLILILFFGLALKNPHLYIRGRMQSLFNTQGMSEDLAHFHGISIELVFLIKAVFFLLFGFTIDLTKLFVVENITAAVIICAVLFTLRLITILVSKRQIDKTLFMAPRGLITILLFIGLPASMTTDLINQEVITLVVLCTMLFMLPASLSSR